MKILTANQIQEWDAYTLRHEPIASIDLMERAAKQCFLWLQEQGLLQYPFTLFCGKGNNGGDGLAIARMLAERSGTVSVYILEWGQKGTEEFQTNLNKLLAYKNVQITYIQEQSEFPILSENTIVIDALFGLGISRPLKGIALQLVSHINQSGCKIISIDLPSGLPADQAAADWPVIHADHTLSFQCYKPALLMAENAEAIGEVTILDIGLHADYLQQVETPYELIDKKIIASLYKRRNPFAHKGSFGHALILAGSYGKMGAAVLAAKACLRSGVGLLSCHLPVCGYTILQTSVPEAMVIADPHSHYITQPELQNSKYSCMGIGPGIGTNTATRKALFNLILSHNHQPFILDADALNCLAMEKKLPDLPAGSLLTPHPKEFERLFGKSENELERINQAMAMAHKLNCTIVLKGHHTLIATPEGKGYFNSTGNAGMATAGSGDVLTGILTGLIAQGISSIRAAILGVYLHGLAGDIAAEHLSMEAMTAKDIINHIGAAFKKIAAY